MFHASNGTISHKQLIQRNSSFISEVNRRLPLHRQGLEIEFARFRAV